MDLSSKHMFLPSGMWKLFLEASTTYLLVRGTSAAADNLFAGPPSYILALGQLISITNFYEGVNR